MGKGVWVVAESTAQGKVLNWDLGIWMRKKHMFIFTNFKIKFSISLNYESRHRNSLEVQWLGLRTFTDDGPGLVPGQGS